MMALRKRTLKPDRLIINSASEKLLEEYRFIRTNLLQAAKTDSAKAILVTSCNSYELPQAVSTNLAASLAMLNQKTLLIDADQKYTSLNECFDKNDGANGLGSYLDGKSKISDIITTTKIDNLNVIFMGNLASNPEIIYGEKFTALIEEVKKNYSFIIINAAPITECSDTAALVSKCDGVVLSTAKFSTHLPTLEKTVIAIEKLQAKILGFVVNN